MYLSNLGEATFGYAAGYGFQSFQTGTAATGYILNSVTLAMGNWDGNASNFVVAVYHDGGGQPGPLLGALSGSNDPETAGLYIYTASGLTLNPGTIYWIVANSDLILPPPPPQPPFGGYFWNFTASPNYSSSDGWSLIPSANGYFMQLALDGASVPEPRALGLIPLGVVVILASRGSRKTRRVASRQSIPTIDNWHSGFR